MATQTPTPTRHIYDLTNPGQYKEVRHYSLKQASNKNELPEMLNISKDRQFSKAVNIYYWLKGKNPGEKKWSKPITGLKPTSAPNIFFGDIPRKVQKRFLPKDLLVFKFPEYSNELIIDVYRGFYTDNKEELHQIIEDHKTYF